MKKFSMILVSIFLILEIPTPALAHAELVSSSISAGSRLNSLPKSVTLNFNESITLDKGSLQLVNGEGKIINKNSSTTNSNKLTLPIAKNLIPDLYGIRYSVTSVDGHRVIGMIPFSYNYVEKSKLIIVSKEIKGNKNTLNLNCKCKKGLSQISVDGKGKRVKITLISKKSKAPLKLELSYNGSLFVSNQLLISDGLYQAEVEVYIDDFNIETYNTTFNF